MFKNAHVDPLAIPSRGPSRPSVGPTHRRRTAEDMMGGTAAPAPGVADDAMSMPGDMGSSTGMASAAPTGGDMGGGGMGMMGGGMESGMSGGAALGSGVGRNGSTDRLAVGVGQNIDGSPRGDGAQGGWAHWRDGDHGNSVGAGNTSVHPEYGEYNRSEYPMDPNTRTRSGPGANGMPILPKDGPRATPYNTGQAHPWDNGANELLNPNHPHNAPIPRKQGPELPPTVARLLDKEASTFMEAEGTTDDRSELLYRARRHASLLTSTWTPEASQKVTEAFCGRVAALIPNRRKVAAQPVTEFADFDDSLLY